jgi:hypothetical protein
MLGYMTAKEAKACGFTHHGKYFGIPVWMGDPFGDVPLVATKWAPMEYLMSVAHVIEGTMRMVLDEPPVFQFMVGKEL